LALESYMPIGSRAAEARASGEWSELVGEEVHRQPVMPPGAVGVSLVAAHDADRTKTDRSVAADRGVVVGCWVDH
jgi:hypothetical protein